MPPHRTAFVATLAIRHTSPLAPWTGPDSVLEADHLRCRACVFVWVPARYETQTKGSRDSKRS